MSDDEGRQPQPRFFLVFRYLEVVRGRAVKSSRCMLSCSLPRLVRVPVRTFKVLHTSEATAVGGRQGKVTAKSGAFALQLDTPTGLGGQGGSGTNPEELFAAGYAACFRGAMGVAQAQLKLPAIPAETTVAAIVPIGKHDNGNLGVQVTLNVHVPGWQKSDVQQLLEKAHTICPYSHATRNNIKVTLNAV